MERAMRSWVEEHKLTTIGAVWATAVAYSRRRATSLRLTVAALGGAAVAHHYYTNNNSKRREDDLDYGFYSQLPPATDADGNENQRWSW